MMFVQNGLRSGKSALIGDDCYVRALLLVWLLNSDYGGRGPEMSGHSEGISG